MFSSLIDCGKFYKVGDFGLARWQPDGDTGEETRVIGTFGYVVFYSFFCLLREWSFTP